MPTILFHITIHAIASAATPVLRLTLKRSFYVRSVSPESNTLTVIRDTIYCHSTHLNSDDICLPYTYISYVMAIKLLVKRSKEHNAALIGAPKPITCIDLDRRTVNLDTAVNRA